MIDSKKKNTLFTILAVLLPVLFFLLLELLLRLFSYAGNTNLIISGSGDQSKYYTINPNAAARYFSKYEINLETAYDVFLKIKPANVYRIFVLGGSTAAGYPYGNNLMFSRILNQRLNDTFPNRKIEVINTAAPAINTYTQLDFLSEILDYKPDAILIYSGHNEFYGALGVASVESLGQFRWFVNFYLKLQRFKIFLLLRNMISGLLSLFQSEADVSSGTLMERMVDQNQIPYGSSLYEAGKEQFSANLRDIIQMAREADIDVMLSELVSNVRDQQPFISVTSTHPLTANQAYARAKAAEKKANFQQAKEQFYLAKDLDALRFRASEDFNTLINNLGREFAVPVVPMKIYFEKQSANELIGDQLMLEHLHPNINGCFIMADAFYETMRASGFVEDEWDSSPVTERVSYRKSWGYTPLDSIYADLRVRILKGGWPFQPKASTNMALLAFRQETKVDSLAVKVWQQKSYTLERAHFDLAVYYERTNDLRRAFDEYNALVCLTPYNVSPYIKAAEILIKAGRLNRAFPILHHSLQLENTAYAQKWIGQILLNRNNINEALPYLERAYDLGKKDPQLLYNLSGAYAMSSQFEKARVRLDELEQINPNFPDAEYLRQQLDRIRAQNK